MDQSGLPKFERDEIKISMLIMGVLVPLICIWVGLDAWITEEAKWPQRRARWVTVEGAVAKSLGIAYLGVSIGCFSHWVLRYFGCYACRLIGMVVGVSLFIGGLVSGMIRML